MEILFKAIVFQFCPMRAFCSYFIVREIINDEKVIGVEPTNPLKQLKRISDATKLFNTCLVIGSSPSRIQISVSASQPLVYFLSFSSSERSGYNIFSFHDVFTKNKYWSGAKQCPNTGGAPSPNRSGPWGASWLEENGAVFLNKTVAQLPVPWSYLIYV